MKRRYFWICTLLVLGMSLLALLGYSPKIEKGSIEVVWISTAAIFSLCASGYLSNQKFKTLRDLKIGESFRVQAFFYQPHDFYVHYYLTSDSRRRIILRVFVNNVQDNTRRVGAGVKVIKLAGRRKLVTN